MYLLLEKGGFGEAGEGEIGECSYGLVKGKVPLEHAGGNDPGTDALPTVVNQ